ncbi:MAG: hypothetical protein ABSD41_12595 [Candidatus Bathyarchaeia archaeon]
MSRRSLLRRLYSLLGAVTLAIAALTLVSRYIQSVWNEDKLRCVTAWRIKLEDALEHGTHPMVEEWKQRGWKFPITEERIQDELTIARKKEKDLVRFKKVANRVLLLLGAALLVLAVLLFVFNS